MRSKIASTINKTKFIIIALNDSVCSLLCLKSRKTPATPASAPKAGNKNICKTPPKNQEDTIDSKSDTTRKTLKNREVFLKVNTNSIRNRSGIKAIMGNEIKIKRNPATHIKARVSEIFVKSFSFKSHSISMITNWFLAYLNLSGGVAGGL